MAANGTSGNKSDLCSQVVMETLPLKPYDKIAIKLLNMNRSKGVYMQHYPINF